MKHAALAVSLVAFLLVMGTPSARAEEQPELADATAHLVKALTDLGVTIGIGSPRKSSGEKLVRSTGSRKLARPASCDQEHVVGFILKFITPGKSRSDDTSGGNPSIAIDRTALKSSNSAPPSPHDQKEPSR